MNWKYIVLGLVALAVLIPAGLYGFSLDWSRKHSAHVAALPLYTPDASGSEFRLKANGMTFRLRAWGQGNDGPPLILLHGFPESSAQWTVLGEKAAAAGYRVFAYDQRGYSPGARPSAVSDYAINLVADDVLAVADALGLAEFHLAGHDWGAVAGWYTVMLAPERILSWSGLSIAHVAAFVKGLEEDPEQQKRSGYFDFFRKPYQPEFIFTYAGQRTLKGLYADMPAAHRDDYLSILAEPGAMTAALNWYRAMDVSLLSTGDGIDPIITRPTLFIWGNKDEAVAGSVIATQGEFIKGPYEIIELDAGHWLMEEEPDAVTAAIIRHLERN